MFRYAACMIGIYLRVSSQAQKSDSQRAAIQQWLARSMREGVNVLTDWCERGVRVVSVTQQIDLSGTIGHLVAGVLFAIAEIELQHTHERQAAGITVAKQKGSTRAVRKARSRLNRNVPKH